MKQAEKLGFFSLTRLSLGGVEVLRKLIFNTGKLKKTKKNTLLNTKKEQK